TPVPTMRPPTFPVPPTAWLLVKVQLLTVKNAGMPPNSKLQIAPPAPRPLRPVPLPPVLLFPPSASLWSNVLFVTVADPELCTAPPTAWPMRPAPLLPVLTLEPPMALLNENEQPSTTKCRPSSFATAPPVAASTT